MGCKFQKITPVVSAEPGRKIGSGHRGSRGWLSFRKTSLAFESTLERDFLIRADADTSVTEIISQPFTLRFTDANGQQRRYTPDYLVRDERPPAGGWIIEIKYRADLVENCHRLLPGFVAARIYAVQHGMRFTVLTEKHIRSAGFVQAQEARRLHLDSTFSRMEPGNTSSHSWRSMKPILSGSAA